MSGTVMLLTLVLATVAVLVVRHRARRRSPGDPAALSPATTAAGEDVSRFGEELQALGAAAETARLDTTTRQLLGRARDAYELARRTLRAASRADEIAQVTAALERGRYAAACVRAGLLDRPFPIKRPPCFFNPAHGPSVQCVPWPTVQGEESPVPACAADAERVLAGASPNIRLVPVGSERVPYWEAGSAYAPWARGYYREWGRTDPAARALLVTLR